MNVLGIDPGDKESGVCLFAAGTRTVLASGKFPNEVVLYRLAHYEPHASILVVEKIAPYGRSVGQEVFDTAEWGGRFRGAWDGPATDMIFRRDVKKYLGLKTSGKDAAGDADVRQALIRLVGKPGTKKAPGPTYGVTGDAWAALGVAVAWSIKNNVWRKAA